MNADCTVLVVSCDEYHDVEAPFIALWQRFWPDCPFEIVLAAETMPTQGFSRNLLTNRVCLWSERVVASLQQIKSPYILLLMNDYFLDARVDTNAFLRRLEEAKKYDVASLRLNPNPPGKHAWGNTDLLEMPKDVAYCVTCQASIWNRDFLLGLAKRNKSAWEFERYGSFQVGEEKRPLLVTPTKEFPFIDAVHKGYWEKLGVAVCSENGVEIDFSKRGLPPLKVRFVEGLKAFIFAVVPNNWIVRVQNALGAGAKDQKNGGLFVRNSGLRVD